MRKVLIGFSVLLFSLILSSCSTGQQSVVVAEFDHDQITLDELKGAYSKSLGEGDQAKLDSTKELEEFLDLYVNYKMKLRDAYVRGFESDPDIQKEIDDYTQTVGAPYILEKFVIEPGVKDLYEKRKVEKRISHILIRTDSIGVDSARHKAEQLLARIKNGESFEKLAVEYSQDDFSKVDSGDVYWLTAGQTVPEFDDAMYQTKKGEIYPEPIETKYGFHIMKVTDEQPRVFKIKARHILSSFAQGTTVDSAAALARIKEVQEKLKNGEAFYDLAIKYSDDKGSAQKGGDLGYFQRRMMVKPFDEAVFGMKVGEISDIVETRFGYHIIQLDEIQTYPSFEDEKEDMKSTYQRSLYAPEKEAYLNKLKQEYSYEVDDSLKEEVSYAALDKTFGTTYWESEAKEKYGDSVVVKMKNLNYTLNDIVDEFKENPNYKDAKMTYMNMFKMFMDFSENTLLGKKAEELKNGNTEFARLMEDYRNGLYIFKLQEEEIWNKLEIDTTQLLGLYEETKEQYSWPNRVSYAAIYRPDSTTIYKDFKAISEGAEFDSVFVRNSKNPSLKSKTKKAELENIASSDLAKIAFSLKNAGDISNPVSLGTAWYIVKLNEKVPVTQKSFEEAKSEVMALWQERQTKKLENDYINHLRKIYEPELFYDRLSEAN